MQHLIPSKNFSWSTAKKTQTIRAKPLINIMVDSSVMTKFLLDTLEGKEVLGDGTLVCLGSAGDVWQQMPKKLLSKYDVSNVDKDGWLVCEPKPDNLINVFEVRPEHLGNGVQLDIQQSPLTLNSSPFYILGLFGEQCEDGLRQYGEVGDFIGQNREHPEDVWVIRRKIFLNTYQLMS